VIDFSSHVSPKPLEFNLEFGHCVEGLLQDSRLCSRRPFAAGWGFKFLARLARRRDVIEQEWLGEILWIAQRRKSNAIEKALFDRR